MRAFIGIKLNDCLDQIIDIQDDLKKTSPKGNFTLKENFHITLSFLGEINEEQIDIVNRIFASIKIDPFVIFISRIKKMRDMIVLEVEDNQSLNKLQKELEERLIANNFDIESRRFNPHITLVRKVEFSIDKQINLQAMINECFLFISERINNVLTYTPINKKKFKE